MPYLGIDSRVTVTGQLSITGLAPFAGCIATLDSTDSFFLY